MAVILRTEGLNKVYRLGSLTRNKQIRALHDVNLNIESDEPAIISVVGESGSGKTTLAKTLLRLVEPTSGRAIVYDKVVAGKGVRPNKREFLRSIQPIFQNPFEAFSRYRPVDAYLHETATRVAGLKGEEAYGAIETALASVGLEYADVRGKYSNQFSGGELQRVSIARALIPEPSLIIADEPVSMIDASRRMIIINLFLKLKLEAKRSFLYITHDLATAYYISDYVAVMNKGVIVEFGTAQSVMGNPQHDYTKLLLSSIPSTQKRWRPRVTPSSPGVVSA
ncbi:ATP-binding cassette domain-containing protein [Devosia sp. J2-20]|jgi:ABC-type oligopeptide transport system ATPase subunit|uniref:ABC transporter ATP-binding protein n=1 Tax=Devosia sp. J2-20 TaxID=3026161 RepID=UPI002499B4A5|nr:ABC transporter ATP-binding protein [Devosia sp. J2-20]WDQ97945.1 ATP-binding cassette domain-containing protein [Devosia sp. J2-20]